MGGQLRNILAEIAVGRTFGGRNQWADTQPLGFAQLPRLDVAGSSGEVDAAGQRW